MTIAVANNADAPIFAAARHPILVETGSEAVAGSTRMNAGTAQKIVLNLFSTAVMVKMGRVYRGLMVDMKPTIDNPAGQYAVDLYLQDKKVNHPEAANWGTPQMIPRIAQGHVVSCQYWDGTCKTIANPKQSKTVGQFYFSLVPGSKFTGKMVHRSISSPLAAILVNKYSPRKAQAAYMALWLGSGKNSIPIVSDPVNAFNDAWAKEHMKAEPVLKAYTPEGIKAVETNFQVVSPPIYLTGFLEFQDALGKNLSEAYVGQLPAKDVLKKTENEWNAIIGRIGRAKLKKDLASYKAVMPTKAVPT